MNDLLNICQCGCGRAVKNRFVHGHNNNRKGAGVGRTEKKGYVFVKHRNHPRTNQRGYVLEHILLAEKALGKPLPDGAVVHHGNGSRNSGPLIICQNEKYHKLLHQRMRALKACGNIHWRKCWICKKYDDPTKLKLRENSGDFHQDCYNEYSKLHPRTKRLKRPRESGAHLLNRRRGGEGR